MQKRPVKRGLSSSHSGDAVRRQMRDPNSVHEIPSNRKQRRALYLPLGASQRATRRRARQKRYKLRKETRGFILFAVTILIVAIVYIAFAAEPMALLIIVLGSVVVFYAMPRLERAARRWWKNRDTQSPKG